MKSNGILKMRIVIFLSLFIIRVASDFFIVCPCFFFLPIVKRRFLTATLISRVRDIVRSRVSLIEIRNIIESNRIGTGDVALGSSLSLRRRHHVASRRNLRTLFIRAHDPSRAAICLPRFSTRRGAYVTLHSGGCVYLRRMPNR